MSKRLCIVPARGGSKRLPGKNSRILGDKPLICHTLDIVKDIFTTVYFTSDSKELLNLAKDYSNKDNIIFNKRDPILASDTSKVIDTVIKARKNLKGYDSIWLSLPTCPFKTREDFEECFSVLEDEEDYYESVVSITDFDFPPSLALNLGLDNSITSTCPSMPWENGHSRSQDHRRCYRPNGAIYGCKWNKFISNWYLTDPKTLAKTYGHYMPPEHSVDIDTEFDFKFAEFLYNEK